MEIGKIGAASPYIPAWSDTLSCPESDPEAPSTARSAWSSSVGLGCLPMRAVWCRYAWSTMSLGGSLTVDSLTLEGPIGSFSLTSIATQYPHRKGSGVHRRLSIPPSWDAG